jgi:type III pantothenate kinase
MSETSLIAVDIGNSATKLGRFAGDQAAADSTRSTLPAPAGTFRFATGQSPPAELAPWLPEERCQWAVSSVHREGTRLLEAWLSEHRPDDTVKLLSRHDLPIQVRVAAPDRVGLDRLAAAVAANLLRPKNQPAIVVGAGSAITVNLVAADGAFAGGAILPGFRMSAEALYGADLLPLTILAPNDDLPAPVGKDTESALRSGLFWGAVGAVRELVARISATLDQPPSIFVTGGDLRQFAEHLGHGARYVPNLVLSGIAVACER